MPEKYRVTLTPEQREALLGLLASGMAPSRTLTHARILLKADEADEQPAWSDAAIAAMLEISGPTNRRVRQRCVEAGLEAALRRGRPGGGAAPQASGAPLGTQARRAAGSAPHRARWGLFRQNLPTVTGG